MILRNLGIVKQRSTFAKIIFALLTWKTLWENMIIAWTNIMSGGSNPSPPPPPPLQPAILMGWLNLAHRNFLNLPHLPSGIWPWNQISSRLLPPSTLSILSYPSSLFSFRYPSLLLFPLFLFHPFLSTLSYPSSLLSFRYPSLLLFTPLPFLPFLSQFFILLSLSSSPSFYPSFFPSFMSIGIFLPSFVFFHPFLKLCFFLSLFFT